MESSERGQIRSWRWKKSGSVAAAIKKVDLLMEQILSVVQVTCVYSYRLCTVAVVLGLKFYDCALAT